MRFDYNKAAALVLSELQEIVSGIDGHSAEQLAHELLLAEKVFVCGVGRVLLMLQAFVKRLNHLGIDAWFVGEINEPAITEKDLLVIGSGSGESLIPTVITQKARSYSARITYIGANAASTIAGWADTSVLLHCGTKLDEENRNCSCQPLSSLFEQSLLLFCDIVCKMIADERSESPEKLWRKHANLE